MRDLGEEGGGQGKVLPVFSSLLATFGVITRVWGHDDPQGQQTPR